MNNGQVDTKPFHAMEIPLGIVSISITPSGALTRIAAGRPVVARSSPTRDAGWQSKSHVQACHAGELVLILCKNRFYLWGVLQRELCCSQELPDNVAHAAFTADGTGIVVVGAHHLSVWNIRSAHSSSQTSCAAAAEVRRTFLWCRSLT